MFTQGKWSVYLGVMGMVTLFVLAGCASRPKYSATDLEAIKTEQAFGIVTKQGTGRFSLKDNWSGQIHFFHTGGITQYIPEGYRSQAGDEVRVVYTKVMRSDYNNEGSPFMNKVYQVYSVTVAPQNKIPEMPMKGKVILIGRGSPSLNSSASFVMELYGDARTFRVYLPKSLIGTIPGGANGLLDRNVEVVARRVPNLRLNCYHYVAEKVTLIDDQLITEHIH